ncbi:Helicase associated domain protein [Streptomyces sp. NPDC059474]|uniref:DEAD/DEAH box helicase n=1 Tax=Streptomyces sp. NPDC059474 TaxID=3346846 RepID=UPI00368073CF
MPATLTDTLKTPLRGHQVVATRNCLNGIREGFPRMTVTMPTGSGKTLVAIQVAHQAALAGNVLVVVPTIDLLYQTADAWHAEGRPGTYLSLCSEDPDPHLPAYDALTRARNAQELAALITAALEPVTVFCTYQSLKKVQDAHQVHHLAGWDLIISDEAHRTAGDADKAWARFHDNHAIPARHRLYMTATPRIVDAEAAEGLLADSIIASMDDPRLYGPVVYRLSLAEAIQEGLLADYEIVAVEVTDEDTREALRNFKGCSVTEESLRLAAAQVALLRAQHTYDLRRTLTFHTFIADATVFAQTLHETAAYMPAHMRCTLSAGAVHSKQGVVERRQVVQDFIDTPQTGTRAEQTPRRAVLSNCRCFCEGVDIPSIDSILFADPKTSSIQIMQAIGRALRQTPGQGKISRIIIPVYLAPGQSIAEGVENTRFDLLHQILISLSVWDEHVFHRVRFLRGDTTRRPYIPARPERADELIDIFDLRHVSSPNQIWDMAFEQAETFYEQNRHLDVPSRYLTEDGFYLGWWIGRQRSLKQCNMLLPERAAALDGIGMLWEHPRHSIEHHMEAASDYVHQHGHLVPTSNESHRNVKLGRWIAARRHEDLEGTLPYCYHRALNEIYPWWNSRWDKSGRWRRTYARALKAAREGQLTFPDLASDPGSALTHWLEEQITRLFQLTRTQWDLLGALPLNHPLAYLLRRPRGASQRAFSRGLHSAYLFWRHHEHLDVPYGYLHEEGGYSLHLGRWIAARRRHVAQLRAEELAALEALDMRWIPSPSSPGPLLLKTSRREAQ